MDKMYRLLSEKRQLLLFIHQISEDHPTMGAKDMYFKLQPHSMGRNAFENFCREEGLMPRRVKNWRRTTDITGVVRFDNLLKIVLIAPQNNI